MLCLPLIFITPIHPWRPIYKVTFSVVPFPIPSQRFFLFYKCSHNISQILLLIVIITVYFIALFLCIYTNHLFSSIFAHFVLSQSKRSTKICFDCANEHYSVFWQWSVADISPLHVIPWPHDFWVCEFCLVATINHFIKRSFDSNNRFIES